MAGIEKPDFIVLAQHHYDAFARLIIKAKYEGKTYEEIASLHADWLLEHENGHYSFLADSAARALFIEGETYEMERIESAMLYKNGAVSVVSDFKIDENGTRYRYLDWHCQSFCGNYVKTDGTSKCKLDDNLP